MLREVLSDLLHSRHTLPSLHCGVAVQFLLLVGINHPSQHSNFFPCEFRGIRSPKCLGSSLHFHFNGIIVVYPGGNIPPFGTHISEATKREVVGTRRKHFASGSLRVTVSGALPTLRPGP